MGRKSPGNFQNEFSAGKMVEKTLANRAKSDIC